jgi:hypothetical protein
MMVLAVEIAALGLILVVIILIVYYFRNHVNID